MSITGNLGDAWADAVYAAGLVTDATSALDFADALDEYARQLGELAMSDAD
jgi:hypothetical protein